MLKVIFLGAGLILTLFVLFLLWTQYQQTSPYHGPVSTHFDGTHFQNVYPYKAKSFLDIFRWKLQAKTQPWPNHVVNTMKPDLSNVMDDKIKVTFVNHATVLIQTASITILTDPIWSERASPLTWFGPKRVREPGISFDLLPAIDLIVISHNHYDHLDIKTLQKLADKFHPLILVPLGNKNLLTKHGISNVIEMDWWQEQKLHGMTITFLPTQHWSARGLNDKLKTLWGSYGFTFNSKKIYFAGDTAYTPNFQTIRQRWGKPDLAFLPIGAYMPEWFMAQSHMNPREAYQAHQDLGAAHSIAIHFGTFQLSDEGINDPVNNLLSMMRDPHTFVALNVGETREF